MTILLGALLAVLLSALPAAAQVATTDVLLQSAAAANGNGTVATITGYQTAVVQVTNPSGSPTFTVNFEGSSVGTTFVALACRPVAGGTDVTTTTAVGAWRCNVAGFRQFRARISGYAGSGTITAHGTFMAGGEVSRAHDVVAQIIAHFAHVTTAIYLTDAGAAAAPAIARAGDTDTGVFWPAANQIALTAGTTNSATWVVLHAAGLMAGANGSLDIGTSAGSRFRALHLTAAAFIGGGGSNANMTRGLTINQLGADDEAIALKSTDSAHGLSDAETTTYGTLRKVGAGAAGGLELAGYRDNGASISGVAVIAVGNSDTTKDATGQGLITLDAYNHDGTATKATPGTDANLVVIRSGSATRAIFDAEGTLHLDDTVAAFDHWRDVHLARAFDLHRGHGVIPSRFDHEVQYEHSDLVRAHLVAPDGPDGARGLWNVNAHVRLLNGAVWQIYVAGQEREERLLARLDAVEREAALVRANLTESLAGALCEAPAMTAVR